MSINLWENPRTGEKRYYIRNSSIPSKTYLTESWKIVNRDAEIFPKHFVFIETELRSYLNEIVGFYVATAGPESSQTHDWGQQHVERVIAAHRALQGV